MKAIRKGHVEAGGVRYGYEIHGAGAPLLLLHGGFGTLDMFAPVMGRLARRQVIAVDLYGHGRTALTDRPIDPVAMGDDLAAVVRALGFERVDVLGFSFGGMVAFRLAVQHPEVVAG
jgi:pimeloyl-ACP methyl ester carboxylesterase